MSARGKRDLVSNGPLREAFMRSPLSQSELARRLGWMRVTPDYVRVRRALGLKRDNAGAPSRWRREIDYDTAVSMCRAMGVDPVDVGL